MSFFGSNNNKSKTIGIFDIGSSGVAFGIAKVFEDINTPPLVMYTYREIIPIGEEIDFTMFVKSMQSALEKTSQKVHDARIGKVDELHCFLGSPWFASQTRTITYSKTLPFNVTPNIISNLVSKEVDLFQKTEITKYAGYQKMNMLETVTIDCRVNGYQVDSPYHKDIKNLDIALFVSMSPKDIVDTIKNIILKSIHVEKKDFHFHTSVFSEYVLLRDLFVHNDNYLIVHIDGEITDVSFIKSNVFYDNISFPSGRNALIRAIATNHGGVVTAQSLLTSYISGHLELSVHNEIDKILEDVRKEWLEQFSHVLSKISSHRSLPSTVFLITEDQATHWFTDAIKREEFSQYMLSEKRFSVIALAAPSINEYCTFKEGVSMHDYDIITHLLFVSRHGNK